MTIVRMAGLVVACATALLVGGGLTGGQAKAVPALPKGAARLITLAVGGHQRTYLIHVPATMSTDRRVPAVLVFHGGGGAPEQMIGSTRFDELGDRYGFVSVYPTGYLHSWNDGRGADSKAGAHGIDDVAFVSALIDRIVAQNNVDPKRVYATGMSNGGMFSQRLGCQLSTKLAGIAPVAGTQPAANVAGCKPRKPMPVLEIHGTADAVVPYEGGVVRHTSGRNGGPGTSPVLSAAATQQLWRKLNGCASPAVRMQQAGDGPSITRQVSTCKGGAKVELYSISGGGHAWPPEPAHAAGLLVGTLEPQFDTSATIWRFFSGSTA